MSAIIILIGISLIIALIFLAAFIFSVRKGQYDDTYSPAHRILFENTITTKNQSKKSKNTNK